MLRIYVMYNELYFALCRFRYYSMFSLSLFVNNDLYENTISIVSLFI